MRHTRSSHPRTQANHAAPILVGCAVCIAVMTACPARADCLTVQGTEWHVAKADYNLAAPATLTLRNLCQETIIVDAHPTRTQPGNVHPIWVHESGSYFTRNRNTTVEGGCRGSTLYSDGGRRYELPPSATCTVTNYYGGGVSTTGLYRSTWKITEVGGEGAYTVNSDIYIHDVCDVLVDAPPSTTIGLDHARAGVVVGSLTITSTCDGAIGIDFDEHATDVLSATGYDSAGHKRSIGLQVTRVGSGAQASHAGGLHTTDRVTRTTSARFTISLTDSGAGEPTVPGRYTYGGTVGYWSD